MWQTPQEVGYLERTVGAMTERTQVGFVLFRQAGPIIIGRTVGAPCVPREFRTFPKWIFGVRYQSWCARRISGCGGRFARSLGKTGLSFCPVCPWVGAWPTQTGIGVDEKSNARQDVARWARCPGQGCPESGALRGGRPIVWRAPLRRAASANPRLVAQVIWVAVSRR